MSEALREVSFAVAPGQTVGLVGRNGAGKSTLLRVVAGIFRPTRGEVRVRGRVCPFLEPTAGFHAELTGRENALVAAVLLGVTRREALQKMDELIDFSEPSDRIDEPIRTYSTGTLARLGFSVVAAVAPEFMPADELSVGDLAFREKGAAKLKEFKSRGVPMLIVSHSPDGVRRICGRVVWLDEGAVRGIGPPDDVLAEYLQSARAAAFRPSQEQPRVA